MIVFGTIFKLFFFIIICQWLFCFICFKMCTLTGSTSTSTNNRPTTFSSWHRITPGYNYQQVFFYNFHKSYLHSYSCRYKFKIGKISCYMLFIPKQSYRKTLIINSHTNLPARSCNFFTKPTADDILGWGTAFSSH